MQLHLSWVCSCRTHRGGRVARYARLPCRARRSAGSCVAAFPPARRCRRRCCCLHYLFTAGRGNARWPSSFIGRARAGVITASPCCRFVFDVTRFLGSHGERFSCCCCSDGRDRDPSVIIAGVFTLCGCPSPRFAASRPTTDRQRAGACGDFRHDFRELLLSPWPERIRSRCIPVAAILVTCWDAPGVPVARVMCGSPWRLVCNASFRGSRPGRWHRQSLTSIARSAGRDRRPQRSFSRRTRDSAREIVDKRLALSG